MKILGLIAVVLFGLKSYGNLKFSPISMSFQTQGKGAHKFAVVENSGAETIPVVIKLTERIVKENGDEDRPKTKDFVVFPPQFVLKPGEKKIIKVSWTGPKDLEFEKAYRILVEQAQVKLKKERKSSGIDIMINYSGSLYVAPDVTEAKVIVKDAFYSKADNKLGIRFHNEGTIHEYLTDLTLKVVGTGSGSKSQEIVLKGDAIKEYNGINLLAKGTRVIKIPWPSGFDPNKEVKVTFDYKKEKS